MTTGIANENAEEEKLKLPEIEPMVEVLPKPANEPPLYVKIREVSNIINSEKQYSVLELSG